jgi:predicted integral membrane protein DUF2275/putative zinc finger protein
MNCEEVSKHLTEYLDKTLDTAMTTRVATHVISCALCRAESNELADCIRQVASLPALDPPLGFANRVMAHVRDMEPKPSLWQRLILPLTSRVPMQATALVLVAIGAIAIYQKVQPLKQNTDVRLALNNDNQVKEKQPTLTKAAPTAQFKEHKIEVKKAVTTSVPADVAKAAEKATSPGTGSLAAQSQQPKATKTSRTESSGDEAIITLKRSPIRVQEVTTARDNDIIFSDPRGFSAPLPAQLNALRQSSARQTAAALEQAIPIGNRITDFEFTVRRHSPLRRDQVESLSAIDTLQKSSESDNVSLAASRPSTPPAAARAKIESIAEIRYYNVAPEHFEIFKKELAAEANIESEPKATAKEIEAAKSADRQLLIKVTILPAETPSR